MNVSYGKNTSYRDTLFALQWFMLSINDETTAVVTLDYGSFAPQS